MRKDVFKKLVSDAARDADGMNLPVCVPEIVMATIKVTWVGPHQTDLCLPVRCEVPPGIDVPNDTEFGMTWPLESTEICRTAYDSDGRTDVPLLRNAGLSLADGPC